MLCAVIIDKASKCPMLRMTSQITEKPTTQDTVKNVLHKYINVAGAMPSWLVCCTACSLSNCCQALLDVHSHSRITDFTRCSKGCKALPASGWLAIAGRIN
jgi:hypothetical protein